jgi:hypothetical protein
MRHGYFGWMQKEAECVTKIAKIIVGGTFIRLERQGTKRRDQVSAPGAEFSAE